MSVHPRPKGERLPEIPIYRAIRNARWIHPDTGELQAVAFLLWEGEPATEGLSVSESGLSSVRSLTKAFGWIELDVKRVRNARYGDGTSLGAEVVADPTQKDPMHAAILGVPPYSPPNQADYQKQLVFGDRLKSQAVTAIHHQKYLDGEKVGPPLPPAFWQTEPNE